MRKGEVEIRTIIIIALLAITFFALLSLFSVKTLFSDILANQNCKNSVRAAMLGNVQGMDFAKEINCPTQYKTLKGDEEQIKKQIAEEMWTCWDNFGQGKYELFSATTDNFCAICSVIDFDKTAKEGNIEINNFEEYIKSRRVLQSNSLVEKMMGIKHEELMFNPESMPTIEYNIDTEKEYSVVFTYAKEGFWSTGKKAVIWGTAAGVVTGVVLIATGVGSPVGIAVIAATVGIAGAATAAAVPTPEAEPDQQKGDAALWKAGIVLIEKGRISELGCTNLPIEQGNK